MHQHTIHYNLATYQLMQSIILSSTHMHIHKIPDIPLVFSTKVYLILYTNPPNLYITCLDKKRTLYACDTNIFAATKMIWFQYYISRTMPLSLK